MSIQSLRNEIRFTAIIMFAVLCLVIFCDVAIHRDYENFKNSDNRINEIVKKGIMPSCLIGDSTHVTTIKR